MGVQIENGLAQVAAAPVVDAFCVDQDGEGTIVVDQPAVLYDYLFYFQGCAG
jgi:hypothetical protein